jgi:hypothetical protein
MSIHRTVSSPNARIQSAGIAGSYLDQSDNKLRLILDEQRAHEARINTMLKSQEEELVNSVVEAVAREIDRKFQGASMLTSPDGAEPAKQSCQQSPGRHKAAKQAHVAASTDAAEVECMPVCDELSDITHDDNDDNIDDDPYSSSTAPLPSYTSKQRELKKAVQGLDRQQTVATMKAVRGESKRPSVATSLSEHALRMIYSRQFEVVVAGLIFLNAIVIGVDADWTASNAASGKSTPLAFRILEITFAAVFTLELCARLIGERGFFVSRENKNLRWNLFDAAAVGITIIQEVAQAVFSGSVNLSIVRLFRLLKIVRVFRIVRVLRFFRDLRVMVLGIINSVKSLMWAILLLILLMYIFGVCVLQISAEEHELRAIGKGVLTKSEYGRLVSSFGSMLQSIYTLWMSMSGGLDWGHAAEPLTKLSPLLTILFSMYIAVAVLCVLNIVTGVFVENANQMYSRDEDEMLTVQVQEKVFWIGEARRLFEAADTDGSGFLDFLKFQSHLNDARVLALLRKLGVEIYDADLPTARGLFALLDFNHSGYVTVDEFTMGLEQIHGVAKCIDIAKVRLEVMALDKKIQEQTELLQKAVGRPRDFRKSSNGTYSNRVVQQRENWATQVTPGDGTKNKDGAARVSLGKKTSLRILPEANAGTV